MELVLTGKKINVDVKKVDPSKTWKGDLIISFCVGIRKVNLCKQTQNMMSTSNDVRNKDITESTVKVQWFSQRAGKAVNRQIERRVFQF